MNARNRIARTILRTGSANPEVMATAAEIVAQEDRDRAVIARIGGNVYRSEGTICRARGYTVAETDELVEAETRQKVNDRKSSRRAQLPESAFDWPIYREAIQGNR